MQQTQDKKILITGGHFMASKSESINKGTVVSFEKAAFEFKKYRNNSIDVNLGVFVNDIGAICSNNTCSISSPGELEIPSKFDEVIDRYKIDREEVLLISEKYIRNRSKRIFHKLRKSEFSKDIVAKKEGYYLHIENNPEILLTRINDQDKYGTPACPLIMTAYSLENERMGFDESINYYYVGSDNLENIPSYLPIEKGRFFSKMISDKHETTNIYLTT